jgi:hypothetical protein
MLLESEQWSSLAGDSRDRQDFTTFLANCEDDLVPDIIEAMYGALVATWGDLATYGYQPWQPSRFEREVNELLYEFRVSYELIEGKMIERESQELHEAVVAPTLRLLSGRTGFEAVEQAYQDALKELADGNGRDAITDAGTALQQTLEAVGCEGNSLGALLASARKRGLLAPHDSPLAAAVAKAADWASSDRSEMGDMHKVTTATRDDAWFTVHVVGALILRLVSGPRS